ncbi:MAG: hypothetical protein QXF41_02720 [Candidatus Micrarchaeaceae archaeon]
MPYPREYIKRFMIFQNYRAIGFSFALFAVIYSISLIMALIFQQFYGASGVQILYLYIIMFASALIVIIGSIVNAHLRTTSIMNEAEHHRHSKYLGKLIITMVLFTIIFLIPIALFSSLAALLMLLSAGGILMSLYVSLSVMFEYKYTEIAVAGSILFLVFLIGFILLIPLYFSNFPEFNSSAFILSSVTIIVVLAIVGINMLYRSAGTVTDEFHKVNKTGI